MLVPHLFQSMHNHPTIWVLSSYYLFSNVVSAMPTPGTTAGGFYHWLFDFLHLTAGNLSRIIAARYPQSQSVQPQQKADGTNPSG